MEQTVGEIEDVAPGLSFRETVQLILATGSGLVGDNPERLHWLEGQARLLLSQGHSAEIVIARAAYGEPASVAEAIRRTRAGFVIAQYGGLTVPTDDLRPLAVALESLLGEPAIDRFEFLGHQECARLLPAYERRTALEADDAPACHLDPDLVVLQAEASELRRAGGACCWQPAARTSARTTRCFLMGTFSSLLSLHASEGMR